MMLDTDWWSILTKANINWGFGQQMTELPRPKEDASDIMIPLEIQVLHVLPDVTDSEFFLFYPNYIPWILVVWGTLS